MPIAMNDILLTGEVTSKSSFMSAHAGHSREESFVGGEPLSFDPGAITQRLEDEPNEFADRSPGGHGLSMTYANAQSEIPRYNEPSVFAEDSSYSLASPLTLPSSRVFSSDVTTFPLTLAGNVYTSPAETQPFFSASNTTEFVDRKSVLGAESSVSTQPIMAHQYRPSLSYSDEQDLYSNPNQQYARTSDRSDAQLSNSYSGFVRDEPSPAGSGISNSSREFASFGNETHDAPPFGEMQNPEGYTLRHSGQPIEINLYAKVEKGFFIAPDNEWTCYRRNYFSVNCSFSLSPSHRQSNYEVLNRSGHVQHAIGFATSISACVDNEKGKVVELIQHTPKRDKGPQTRPSFVKLQPRSTTAATVYGNYNGAGPSALYNPVYEHSNGQPQIPTEYSFERIQFKQATANNGKRRAAQQYYHVIVSLYADVGTQAESRYVKLGSRSSAALVVRGRSPGHYQDARSNPRPESDNGSIFGGGMQYARLGMAEQRLLPGLPSQSSYMYSNSYDDRDHNQQQDTPRYDERDYGSSQAWADDRHGAMSMTLPATPSYSETDPQTYDRSVAYTFTPPDSSQPQSYSACQPLSSGPYTPGTAVYMPTMPTYSMSPPNSVYRDDRSNSFASNGSLAPYNPGPSHAGPAHPASPRPRFDGLSRELPLPPIQPHDRFQNLPSANGLQREYFASSNYGGVKY